MSFMEITGTNLLPVLAAWNESQQGWPSFKVAARLGRPGFRSPLCQGPCRVNKETLIYFTGLQQESTSWTLIGGERQHKNVNK